MSNGSNNQLLNIRCSDGVVYSVPKQIMQQHTPYFNNLLNIPSKDSNYTTNISIDVEEISDIIGPLIQMIEPQILAPKIDLDNFETFLSTYEAALKYKFDKILEQIRVDLRPKAIGDKAHREQILLVATQYNDEDIVKFIFLLNESEATAGEVEQDQVPPGLPPRSHRNQEEEDQPFFPPIVPPFAPPASPPPSLHANQARPHLPSFSSSATFVERNPEAANRTRITSASIDGQSESQINGSAWAQPSWNPEGAAASPPPPAYNHQPAAGIAQVPLNNNMAIPQSLSAEFATVNSLKDQLRQAQARNAHPDVIAEHHLQYSIAESALADKLGQYTPVKEPMVQIEPIRPAAAPIQHMPENAFWEPLALPAPNAIAPEKPRGMNLLRRQFRPANGVERNGAPARPRRAASSFAICILGIFFCLFFLGGFGTELGLSIVISQGTQKTTLNPSLVQIVQCANLGTSKGSCNPPYHWSLYFAYASPILALFIFLWTWFSDPYSVLRFTRTGWFVTALAVLGAAAGTTLLSVSGYSTSDCSTCTLSSVYVPTSKLRTMNRGQAVGAWLVLIGLMVGTALRSRRFALQ